MTTPDPSIKINIDGEEVSLVELIEFWKFHKAWAGSDELNKQWRDDKNEEAKNKEEPPRRDA